LTRRQGLLCLLLAVTAAAGLLARRYGGTGAWLIRGSIGGFFYVLFWCLLAFLLCPRLRPGALVLAVVGATCLIEFAQLWRPPFLEAVRRTAAGELLVGSVFGWADLPWYFAGGLAARLAERALPPGRSPEGADLVD